MASTLVNIRRILNDNPDEARSMYDAEVAGKNRASLLSQLEPLIPFDPGDWTVPEVMSYAHGNPDEVPAILASEEAGKNRATLISQLQAMT
jgi:hypothetical protein